MILTSPLRALLLLLALLAPAVARAHASLVFAHPADGTVLQQAPGLLRLRFNEAVTPLVARIIDPRGAVHDDAVVSAQGDTVEISPRDQLRNGTYTLSWRVISADGHPVGGSLSFSIGHASGSPTAVEGSGARDVAIWFFRSLLYVTLLFGVGGAAFLRWATPLQASGQGRRRALALLAASAVAAVASLGLHGLDMRDLDATALLTHEPWRAALGASYGATIALALAAAAASAVALLTTRQTPAKALLLMSLACIGAAFAASGHASVARPQWLMVPSIFAHVVAVALLVGPLPILAGFFGEPGAPFRNAMLGAARIAFASLAIVIASGLAIAIVEVERFGALVETAYGLVLLAKLAALTGAVSLVFLGRRPKAQPDTGGHKPTRKHFLRAELALIVCAMMLTALWRFTPPPRAAAPVERTLHIHTDKMMAMVSFNPGRAGPNSVRIELMTGDFGALEPREVTLVLTPENRSIESVERQAVLEADGRWTIQDVRVPSGGDWRVEVDALVTDFDKIDISDHFDFQP